LLALLKKSQKIDPLSLTQEEVDKLDVFGLKMELKRRHVTLNGTTKALLKETLIKHLKEHGFYIEAKKAETASKGKKVAAKKQEEEIKDKKKKEEKEEDKKKKEEEDEPKEDDKKKKEEEEDEPKEEDKKKKGSQKKEESGERRGRGGGGGERGRKGRGLEHMGTREN